MVIVSSVQSIGPLELSAGIKFDGEKERSTGLKLSVDQVSSIRGR